MSSKSTKTSFGLSPIFIVVLALLTAIAPLATDMYLAALPAVAENLNTTSTNASLTLSGFMVGMALGQLVVGPLSDKTGRRKPLLIGAVICFIATVACGFAPNIELLIFARFMMGFTGSIGAVLARSIVADTTEGLATAKLMGVMMMINGFAPVLAPLFGGWVLSWGSWRDIFHVLGMVTAVMMLGVMLFIKETLPVEKRYQGTTLSVYSELPKVFKIRRYLGFMLTLCFAFAALFSYISGSTFVLQKILGMSETEFTIVFGVNSFGIVLFSAIATKLVGRVAQRRIVNVGVVSLLVVSSLLTVSFLVGISLVPTLVLLFLLTSSCGLIFGSASALALNEARHMAGSASAVMGTVQAMLGALAAPLVSIAGEHEYLPMGFSILGFAVLTALVLWTTPRKDSDYSADGESHGAGEGHGAPAAGH
ncbi:multidrug effflux MFS transporter [Rothia mucilaginosa]|uniref:multidrug effflux MFS transporter n=1 Tax=Rothia mucilaginosa TaxID=43675 RepID=UPI0026EFDE8E|nr:multidrug effflux MFS transporter [Rothia mucilaginosa]